MRKKISAFIGILIGIVSLLALSLLITSLAVRCDLQSDQSYTCQARDTLFGITLIEVNAEQVRDIEYELKCKGAGPNSGCSAHAEFITSTGEIIILSKLYTGEEQNLVNVLKPLMADKVTTIDMVFPPSTFTSIVIISLGSCFLLIFIFVGFILIFGKDVKDLRRKD